MISLKLTITFAVIAGLCGAAAALIEVNSPTNLHRNKAFIAFVAVGCVSFIGFIGSALYGLWTL